jgi:hypothetical protein
LSRRVEEPAAEAEVHDLSGVEAELADLERLRAVARKRDTMKREREGG